MAWQARFSGNCENCDSPITPGQLIEWEDPDERSLVHVACDEAAPSRPRVCIRCFLEHAGECF